MADLLSAAASGTPPPLEPSDTSIGADAEDVLADMEAAADGGAAEEKGEKGEELIHGCLDAKDMAMLKLMFAGTDEDDSKAIDKVGSILDTD